MSETQQLDQTPFHQYHIDHGAKLVPYAGWEMPLLYSSIIEEHRQVRESGGLFDVSHMGRLRISGRHARRFLDRVCTRLVRGMAVGMHEGCARPPTPEALEEPGGRRPALAARVTPA